MGTAGMLWPGRRVGMGLGAVVGQGVGTRRWSGVKATMGSMVGTKVT